MSEEDKQKSEESPQKGTKPAEAASRPEEGKKPGPGSKLAFFKPNKTSLLWAALFGAMVMNAVLLGLVSVKPSRIVEKYKSLPTQREQQQQRFTLPEDIPNPEKHIDILLGMADTQRKLGNYQKAIELYNQANRAFDASAHAEELRKGPLKKAEALFGKKNYRDARNSYYAFLATADELDSKEQVLVQQAHFRIAECYLLEALSQSKEAHK